MPSPVHRPVALAPSKPRKMDHFRTAPSNWEWAKIDESFNKAAKYVSPEFSKKFLDANQEQIRVAREKKVSQRFYLVDTKSDIKAKSVKVTGDRILLVEGLRASNPLSVEVQFDYGARTEENPEGIYVTGEKLVSLGEGGAR